MGDLKALVSSAGQNYSAIIITLDIISGLSVAFLEYNGEIGFESDHDRGQRFKTLLSTYYPWDNTSFVNGLTQDVIIDVLWKFLRNPFVHSLSISKAQINPFPIDRVTICKNEHLTKEQYEELENVTRPKELPTTFTLRDRDLEIGIESMYWDLQELIRQLFSNTNQMNFIETWYSSH